MSIDDKTTKELLAELDTLVGSDPKTHARASQIIDELATRAAQASARLRLKFNREELFKETAETEERLRQTKAKRAPSEPPPNS